MLASAIPGNTGLLGDDHPGLFEPGNPQDLVRLMLRVEREPDFAEKLADRSNERAALAAPEREAAAWLHLLDQLGLAR